MSSPFAANPRRYRRVPKRVKNPKTQSGCLMGISIVATTIALILAVAPV